MPQMMEGTPLSTSAAKRIHRFNREEPYSERYTPPKTPTGTPMAAAMASNMSACSTIELGYRCGQLAQPVGRYAHLHHTLRG